MYWHWPRCLKLMGGLAEYESGRFRPPKGVQEDSLSVHSQILKVHSTKTSGQLRFSEIGKQLASKNLVSFT